MWICVSGGLLGWLVGVLRVWWECSSVLGCSCRGKSSPQPGLLVLVVYFCSRAVLFGDGLGKSLTSGLVDITRDNWLVGRYRSRLGRC